MDPVENDYNDTDAEFYEEAVGSGESHGDYVNLVRGDMYDVDRVYDLAELFKIFGDSTRLRIMSALLNHELCVCDISLRGAGNEPVGNIPPAPGAADGRAYQGAALRQIGILFARRRPCEEDHRDGL